MKDETGPVRGAREAAERIKLLEKMRLASGEMPPSVDELERIIAQATQRPTCSACGHVHQPGRITCGHFIRKDPHQGEICCECVAAPAGGAE